MNLLFQFYVLKVLAFMAFHFNVTKTYAMKDIYLGAKEAKYNL